METRFKFRAWIKEKNKMVYGPTDDNPSPSWIIALPIDDKFKMQWTGIVDQCGRDIYEGDILVDPTWWWGARFVYLLKGECGPCEGDSVMKYILSKYLEDPLMDASHNIWSGSQVRVIGNIYQNPDLIGFGKENRRVGYANF